MTIVIFPVFSTIFGGPKNGFIKKSYILYLLKFNSE